jgi:hypothetical protein
MKVVTKTKWALLMLSIFFLSACGGGDSGSSSSEPTGTLSLSMIDASDETYKAVYVTIKEVQVCYETGFAEGEENATCEWKNIVTLNKTYNLLTLVNGVTAALGEAKLEVGTYNQMRLILGDDADDSLNIQDKHHPFPQYLVAMDDQVHEMKVPSGYQSGIKLVSPFEIEDSERTELILDFDVTRSIHLAGTIGKNGKYILKPTIKVIDTYNRAVVSGRVLMDTAYLENATVTAWPSDDESLTATSTQTDANGAYTLYLGLGENPGASQNFALVATLNGYTPDCVEALSVEADQEYTQDFELSNTNMVTISGTVKGKISSSSLPEGATYPSVHISFQQDGDCGIPVEVAFTDTEDDENNATADIFYDSATGDFQYKYEINVPSGTYDVVASTEGLTSVEILDFDATVSATQDFTF